MSGTSTSTIEVHKDFIREIGDRAQALGLEPMTFISALAESLTMATAANETKGGSGALQITCTYGSVYVETHEPQNEVKH